MMESVSVIFCFFFFSSRRRHTRCSRDWSSDVCSSDLVRSDGIEVHGAVPVIVLRSPVFQDGREPERDRMSTRLNSIHGYISYAVFCLNKNSGDAPFHAVLPIMHDVTTPYRAFLIDSAL